MFFSRPLSLAATMILHCMHCWSDLVRLLRYSFEFQNNTMLAGSEKICIMWGSLGWKFLHCWYRNGPKSVGFETGKVLNSLTCFTTSDTSYFQYLVGFCGNVSLQFFSCCFGLWAPCIFWPFFFVLVQGSSNSPLFQCILKNIFSCI